MTRLVGIDTSQRGYGQTSGPIAGNFAALHNEYACASQRTRKKLSNYFVKRTTISFNG
jgi:hypothetical protein